MLGRRKSARLVAGRIGSVYSGNGLDGGFTSDTSETEICHLFLNPIGISLISVLVRTIIKHGAFAAGSEARPLLEGREVCMGHANNGWIFHFRARGGEAMSETPSLVLRTVKIRIVV